MRKTILWLSAAAALVVPAIALQGRIREQRQSGRELADGVAILEAPIEQVHELASADVSRARALFERAYRADPGTDTGRRARALMHVAQAYADLSRGEFVMALQETDTAAGLFPHEPHVSLASAEVALRRGDRAAAERALEALAQGTREQVPAPVAARASLLRVDMLLEQGRVHDALALAESLDREHPAVAAVKNLLGLARAGVGDVVGAREAFERSAALDPRSETALVNLARLLRDQHDLEGARAVLDRALQVAPEGPEAWLAYGAVLADLRDPGARAALVHAGNLLPDDPAPYVAQGNLDLADGNAEGAIESFRGALARDADNATAQTNLGVALARLGRHREATEAFEQATRRAPHQGQAWNGLGAMRLFAEDFLGAVGPLQQASTLLPNDPNPPMNLGLAFEGLRRWTEAVHAFREALRREPNLAAASAHLLRLVPPESRPQEAQRIRLAQR